MGTYTGKTFDSHSYITEEESDKIRKSRRRDFFEKSPYSASAIVYRVEVDFATVPGGLPRSPDSGGGSGRLGTLSLDGSAMEAPTVVGLDTNMIVLGPRC